MKFSGNSMPKVYPTSKLILWNVLPRYRIARKFDGELNLVVWRIDQPTAKLKSANIKSLRAQTEPCIVREMQIGGCGLWQ